MDEDFPRVRALFGYEARSDNELSFKAGDIITILDMVDDSWWLGKMGETEGFVAAEYVEHAPVDEVALEEGEQAVIAPKPVSAGRGERPDLAKAVKMHMVKTKHDLTPKQGEKNEFQWQFQRIKNKPEVKAPPPGESEFMEALKRRSVLNEMSKKKEEEEANMTELQRKFSKRNPAPAK